MKVECFSQSKYKAGDRTGDDVIVCLPGRVYGVFDGATDALGTVVDGQSVGRIAAMTVADVIVETAMTPALAAQDGATIIRRCEAALAARNTALNLPIPAATTLAVVLEQADTFRVLMLGDSEIRVNGTDIIGSPKLIDAVSTSARIASFRALRRRGANIEEAGRQARRCILLGFDQAVADGIFTARAATTLVTRIAADPRFTSAPLEAQQFLKSGIKTQFHFANSNRALGYASMNGTPTMLSGVIERVLPRTGVRSLELYTDGYFARPDGDVSVAAWERAFHRAERLDPHKINRYPGAKGTTATEFSDDRSVISIQFPPHR